MQAGAGAAGVQGARHLDRGRRRREQAQARDGAGGEHQELLGVQIGAARTAGAAVMIVIYPNRT